MTITEEFKNIIDEDISKCEHEIKSGSQNSRNVLYRTLISKYGTIIDGFKLDLLNVSYNSDGTYVKRNLETLKQKLVLFKAMDYKNIYAEENQSVVPGVIVNNTNNFTPTINITFEDVKRKIEGMTSLTEADIAEIHEKIEELEKIIESKDRKTKKWDNAKSIIKWIADKGVEVGISMLPLLMKIGE